MMTKDILGVPLEQGAELSTEEVERLSDVVIVQMEETQPEVWFIYLYERGLLRALGQFLPESPFRQVSPVLIALGREIERVNPHLSGWKLDRILRAIKNKTTNEMISKYLEFKLPKSE